MSGLEGLAAGDALVVHDSQGRYSHRKVARVGRVWLTDDSGDRFRIADGCGGGQQADNGTAAMTVAEWDLREEIARLTERLRGWGWVPARSLHDVTPAQMRRMAALLGEFEAENSGGPL